MKTIILILVCLSFPAKSYCYSDYKLAKAIFQAEHSKKHPYGILKHYKHTTPKQACLNTIRNARKRFEKSKQTRDFIAYLSLTYCPVGAKNDPKGLNRNWVKNVNYFLKRRANG